MNSKTRFIPQYGIGDKVQFTGTVDFSYNEENCRVPYRRKAEGTGFVVGCRRVPLGKYIPKSTSQGIYFDGGEYEQAELHITHTQPVYLIRTRLFGKEFQVLPEDVKGSN